MVGWGRGGGGHSDERTCRCVFFNASQCSTSVQIKSVLSNHLPANEGVKVKNSIRDAEPGNFGTVRLQIRFRLRVKCTGSSESGKMFDFRRFRLRIQILFARTTYQGSGTGSDLGKYHGSCSGYCWEKIFRWLGLHIPV